MRVFVWKIIGPVQMPVIMSRGVGLPQGAEDTSAGEDA